MSTDLVESLEFADLADYCVDSSSTAAALFLQAEQLQTTTPIIYLNDCLAQPEQQHQLFEVPSITTTTTATLATAAEFPLPMPVHETWTFVQQPTATAAATTDAADADTLIYVCCLCMRQYDLLEDLRGHMLEYHKCTPMQYKRKRAAVSKQQRPLPGMLKVEMEQPAALHAADDEPEQQPEMQPMPFKDFRLALRAKLSMRCAVTYACSYKFETQAKREMHAKCHVPTNDNSLQFQCSVCGSEMPNWRRCAMHLWRAHQLDVDLLHCPLCNYKSHASVLVWRHMRVHSKWRTRVVNSLRAVAKRNMLKNIELTAATLQQQQLLQLPPLQPAPAAAANKNRYYAEKICDICERKFVNAKTLSKHVKTVHNKMKPFICNVCGMKTARKASLIIHMRQHTGEKPLQCKHCKFCTRDPSALSKHQMRHDDKVGKFKCENCDYSSIQTNAIKRHIRQKHPEEYHKIACDLCTFVTISAERLEAHKADHRKGLIVAQDDSMDATRINGFKYPQKMHFKNEISADCFLPLESSDSLPHEPAVDTGGVTIPAPLSEDTQTQFPAFLI